MKTKEQILIEALDKFGVCYRYEENSYIDDKYNAFEAIFEAMEEYRTQDRTDDAQPVYETECDCAVLKHFLDDNEYFYSGRVEYDQCVACGKILNLKVL